MILKALCITKTLRVVKLTAITLLAVCLHASATVSSQKVTLSAKNASLEEVFAKIKKQTGYLFFFDQSWIAKAKKVTVEIHDETLPAALDECFKDQAITYTIVGDTIVIRPKPAPLITVPAGNSDLPPPPLQITGSVVDEQNAPLEGVSVEMKGSSIGTTTDAKGVFRLEIPNGKGILVFSHVGYEGIEIRIRGRSVLNATLKLQSNSLNEVVAIGYGTKKK